MEKIFKKSEAFGIGMFLKGFDIRRSSSSVILHDALASIANSKNLLPFESRQAVIISQIYNYRILCNNSGKQQILYVLTNKLMRI